VGRHLPDDQAADGSRGDSADQQAENRDRESSTPSAAMKVIEIETARKNSEALTVPITFLGSAP
jgi:hypothetical protein